MEQKNTHIENPLTTLKETLVNAISTIDRLIHKEQISDSVHKINNGGLECQFAIESHVDNPVLERYTKQEVKDILGIPKVDSWCVQLTEDNRIVAKNWDGNENWHYKVGSHVGVNKSGMKNGIYDLKWAVRFDRLISTEEFYNKIGYTKPTENILEKSKQVLNSQNELGLDKIDLLGSHHYLGEGDAVSTSVKIKKEVLFTTEDGVDIYEGDGCCYVNKKTFDKGGYFGLDKNILDANDFNDYVHFSKREKSAEYILMNKPLLSLNDLNSVWNNGKLVDRNNSIMFELFKGIAKEKLNNK